MKSNYILFAIQCYGNLLLLLKPIVKYKQTFKERSWLIMNFLLVFC